MSTGYPRAPRTPHENTRLSSISFAHNDSLPSPAHPPRNYNQVFHSTSDLATHHGIPQSLPPPPRPTTRRPSEPEPIPDFGLPSLCLNYLTMLASNKPSEQTSISEDRSSAVPMSANDKAATQTFVSALSDSPDFRAVGDVADEAAALAIASALSGPSLGFLNPTEFLASPVSPWDNLLTTPALDTDADMGMTPDVYTSPALMDFVDDFDDLPPLFSSTAYDGYDAKATTGSSLAPSHLPLPDMDNMYKISPGTPTIDAMSLQASPLHVDDSCLPARQKNVPTGTRKNITPESLVPFDAPIQPRNYRLPSATSRRDLPTTFARKRARTQGPDEDDGSVGPTLSEEDAIKTKRLQNTIAARKSRKRKLEYQHELEDAIENERKEKEMWRAHAFVLEALLRDNGHEVPRTSDA